MQAIMHIKNCTESPGERKAEGHENQNYFFDGVSNKYGWIFVFFRK